MLADWVMQKVNAGGTGNITLGDSLEGFIGVGQVFNNGESLFYTIEDGYARENGIATYNSSGNYLTRTQILETLNEGTFDDTEPSAINVSTSAVITITPTTRGLTTHVDVWKELPCNLTLVPDTDVLSPDMDVFIGSIKLPHFDSLINEEMSFVATFNNDVAEGNVVYPVIKWCPTSVDSGNVRCGVALSIAEIGGTFIDAGIVYLTGSASGVTNAHQLIEASSTLVAPAPNSIMIGRVFRDSTNAGDTYVSDAVLLSVSMNYQADKVGTPSRNSDHNNWS